MRYMSLFTGCGLLDLGLERAGWLPVLFCEQDQHCQRILAQHWPGVPICDDVREVAADTAGREGRWGSVGDAGKLCSSTGYSGTIDLIVGGFPCQPVSYAGQRQAQSDDRWLWPEMARVIRAVRPRLVLVENVPGLATAGLGLVLGDLAEAGYDCEWVRVRASDVGAPHRRERLFIIAALADTAGVRRDGHQSVGGSAGAGAYEGRMLEPARDRATPADTDDGRCEQHDPGEWRVSVTSTDSTQPVNWGAYEPAIRRWEAVMGTAPAPTDEKGRLAPAFVEWMMGAPDGWTEGVSRTQQLKMLGNGVQVQVGTLLGEALRGLNVW